MRSKFYQFLLALLLSGYGSVFLQAQTQEVIIANGGVFGSNNFVTIASYNPVNGNYFIFDSIPASSVQDVIIHGNVAYVAADSILRSYDLSDYSMLASADEKGVRQLAVWRDKLLVTRGFGASDKYLKIYDRAALTNGASDFVTLKGEAEGIAVLGDSAYVAVPVGFASDSTAFTVVDLNTKATANFELDSSGTGINSVFVDHTSRTIYSMVNLSFGATSRNFIKYVPGDNSLLMTAFPFPISSLGGIRDGKLYGNYDGEYTRMNLPFYSLDTASLKIEGLMNDIASTVDSATGEIFITATDYFSYGRLYHYSAQGNFLDSLEIGISPEALAIHEQLSVNRNSPFSNDIFISTFPNPATDYVNLDLSRLNKAPESVDLIGFEGKLIRRFDRNSTQLDLTELPQGTYFVRVRTSVGTYVKSVVKF